MPRNFLFLCMLAALFYLCSASAYADVNDIRWADNGIEVDGGASHLKYGENSSGFDLDDETGWTPAFAIGGTMLTGQASSPVLSNLFLHLGLNYTDGDDLYNGHLQDEFGNILGPYQTQTHETIYTVSAQVGHAFTLGNMFMLTPFVDLGYRSWNRQILGAYPGTEDYTNKEAMAGALFQVSPFSGWVFSLSGEAGTTVDPNVDIKGGPTLSLNEETIYRFEGKVGYALSSSFEVTSSLRYEGFGFGTSGTAFTTPELNAATEPQSYTHQATALVGIAFHP